MRERKTDNKTCIGEFWCSIKFSEEQVLWAFDVNGILCQFLKIGASYSN